MSGVILPGRHGLILLREPSGHCAVCEIPFYGDADMKRHFVTPGHAEQVQAAIVAKREQESRLAFLHEDVDPEVREHLERVGKRMRAEGRWTVKPSERAGFS